MNVLHDMLVVNVASHMAGHSTHHGCRCVFPPDQLEAIHWTTSVAVLIILIRVLHVQHAATHPVALCDTRLQSTRNRLAVALSTLLVEQQHVSGGTVLQ